MPLSSLPSHKDIVAPLATPFNQPLAFALVGSGGPAGILLRPPADGADPGEPAPVARL
jgi:hypothetical protein